LLLTLVALLPLLLLLLLLLQRADIPKNGITFGADASTSAVEVCMYISPLVAHTHALAQSHSAFV
jgi:hypothetical protein